MNVEIKKTEKPYGLFCKQMTTRFEVWVDGEHRATFAGQEHLQEAEDRAKQCAAMIVSGADETEVSNFIADYNNN